MPPPGTAGERIEQLRERARAARAAQSARLNPPPWVPPAGVKRPGEATDADAGSSAAADAPDAPAAEAPPPLTRETPADDAPVSVPFRPAAERDAAAAEITGDATPSRPRSDSVRRATAVAGERLSGAGHWVADHWATLPDVGRARILAALIVAAVAALIWFVVIPSAPCAAPGGDQCPPGDDAIALVPDDAIAYVHVDVDSDTAQFEAGEVLAERLPLLTDLVVSDVSSVAGRPIDFNEEVRPWSGGEAALAVMPGAGKLGQVLMLEAGDEDDAREFADGLLGPAAVSNDIGGTEVLVADDGFSTVLHEGFLLLGEKAAVAQVVDPAPGSGPLESSSAAAAIDRLPDETLAYAYLSPTGARSMLGSGSLRSLDTFVDSAATSGVAASISVEGDYADISIRSDLDPERAETAPGFFAALPRFEPALTADVGADALAYLGIGDPGSSVASLREQAAAEAPDLLASFDRFEKGLRKDAGISIEKDVLPLLGSELAASIEPVYAGDEAPTPGTVVSSGTPYISLLAAGVDETEAGTALAELQEPVIDAFAPKDGARVPAFESAQIGGVEAQSLFLNPQIDLTYATFDDRLLIATDRLAVRQTLAEEGGLASSESFAALADPLPDEVSLLAYLNLDGLIGLGEQVGLAEDPVYATFASDLRNLRSAALAVVGGDGAIDTDLRIATGAPVAVGVDSSPLSGD